IPQQIGSGVAIEEALRRAHQKIVMRGREQPELRGLGTTVVVVHEQGLNYELAWSGDSRIYRWRHGQLTQRSEDQSFVQRMLKSSRLSESQACNRHIQHVIRSGLASTSSEGLEMGYKQDAWEQGDWLLLCSDGFTDELDYPQMAAILNRSSEV